MKITEEQLARFMELYRREFGLTPDRAQAYESAYHLISLVRALLDVGVLDDLVEPSEDDRYTPLIT